MARSLHVRVITERHWRLGSDRDEHHFRVVEPVPQPQVPAFDPSDPCPPNWPEHGLEIGGTR